MNETLFYDNVNLVFRIVNRLNYNFHDKDDLIQAGLMGLNQASLNFDSTKNASFPTYATYYIIGEIKKEIRNNRPIKLSKEIYKTLRKIKNIDENLSLEELSEILNVSKETLILAINYKENVISLNNNNDDLELINTIPDKNRDFSFELIYNLDKVSQEIILLKYFKGYTQKEIAKILKLSQSKVSRLEALAINTIRNSH